MTAAYVSNPTGYIATKNGNHHSCEKGKITSSGISHCQNIKHFITIAPPIAAKR